MGGVNPSLPARAVREVLAHPGLGCCCFGVDGAGEMAFATQVTPPAQVGWFWNLRRTRTVSGGVVFILRSSSDSKTHIRAGMDRRDFPLASTHRADGEGNEFATSTSLCKKGLVQGNTRDGCGHPTGHERPPWGLTAWVCAEEGDEGMKPPGNVKSSPPPLAGLQASQGSSALDEGATGGARRVKREGVSSRRCWGDGRALAVPSPPAAEHGNSGFGEQKAFPLQKQTWCNAVAMLGG